MASDQRPRHRPEPVEETCLEIPPEIVEGKKLLSSWMLTSFRDFTDVDDTTTELRRHLKPIRVGSFLRKIMGWIGEALSAIERRRWSDLERPFWEERGI